MSTIEQQIWGITDSGEAVVVYTITNSVGASVKLCNIGAGIIALCVPDKEGKMADVVLGYRQWDGYLSQFRGTMGKTPGRVAGRIAKGHLVVDGKAFQLPCNAGENHLHGGAAGFSMKIWDGSVEGDRVVFSLVSPDGEMGYPGNLRVEVSYTFNDNCELEILAMAQSDATTVVNLTNHSYFNLAGEASGSVLEHELMLVAKHYLPADVNGIPTGEIADVANTQMDFRNTRPIGQAYDNCWVTDNWNVGEIKLIAKLYDNKSGRTMEVLSNQPSVTVYTGSFLGGLPAGKTREYNNFDGIAIECEGLPDAPNHPNFPSIELKAGETYTNKTIYRFY